MNDLELMFWGDSHAFEVLYDILEHRLGYIFLQFLFRDVFDKENRLRVKKQVGDLLVGVLL